MFLDEDDVPLSELQKAMILKDTSSISQQSFKAFYTTTPDKSSTVITHFVYDTNIFESILPTPSPSHNTLHAPNPIPQPPLTNITILEPVTETPINSETQLQQQQQKPQTPPHPQILYSPIPPTSKYVFALQPHNPNKAPKMSHLRYSGNQEFEGTPEGLFNYEPTHIFPDSDAEQF